MLEEPGSGQRQLAKRMGVDAVSFGQMIDFLEQRSLVKREVDPDDRRARRLYVTRQGTYAAGCVQSCLPHRNGYWPRSQNRSALR